MKNKLLEISPPDRVEMLSNEQLFDFIAGNDKSVNEELQWPSSGNYWKGWTVK
jgi:hypothetical protein